MKILILSDCHANIDALQAVWEKEGDCDAILFAGDMIDFGFFPKETIRWFSQRKDKLFAVLGNHDEAILKNRYAPVDRNRKAQSFTELNYQEMGDEEYDFLASLPHECTFTLGDTDFYMCHTTDEISDEVTYVETKLHNFEMYNFFRERFTAKFPHASAPKKCIVYGHSHSQWAASAGPDCLILNPGSLSYRFGSFEPVRCSDYIVLENGGVFLRHVNFDTTHLEERSTLYDFDEQNRHLTHAFYRKA